MPSLSWSTISLLLGSFSLTANAVQTISAVGSKFFYEDGTQYFLKGIAYQLIPEDPLIDVAQCKRDAALMGELGANSIRVYHVDPKANHDGCMKAFADKGIYLFLDLDTFDTAIDQVSPFNPLCPDISSLIRNITDHPQMDRRAIQRLQSRHGRLPPIRQPSRLLRRQ